MPVDVDAYVTEHRAEWDRLQLLVSRSSRPRRMSGAELDELVDLYQRVATHLSVLRTASSDTGLVDRLSALVAESRAAVSGARDPAWREVSRFFTETFPAAVYLRWRWVVAVTAVSVALAVGIGWWVATHPAVQASIATPDDIQQLVDHDFADYYSSNPAGSFAAKVWTNNAWVAAVAITFGALLLPTAYVLFQNSANVGIAGGLMVANDRGDVFFGLILPHGMLELTAVFVAAATGLRLGWSFVDAGPRRRVEAVAAEGRSAFSVAIGLVVVLLVSGAIEGFVTPSGLPTWARIGIGALAEGLFVTYVWRYGRRAVARGRTGDLGDDLGGDSQPVSR